MDSANGRAGSLGFPFIVLGSYQNFLSLVAQKPRRRQVDGPNAKVCSSESAILLFLLLCSDHFVNVILKMLQVLTFILSRNSSLSQRVSLDFH